MFISGLKNIFVTNPLINKKTIDIYNIIHKQIGKVFNNKKFQFNHNFNTKFELFSLHLFIVIFSNKNKSDLYRDINQKIIELFISDLDNSFRELGIGDNSIGKYVKKHVKKLYYRFSLYEEIVKNDDFNKFESFFKKKLITNIDINNEEITEYFYNYLRKNININTKKVTENIKFIELL